MITTDAPAWLRRSDQAVTWARTMLTPGAPSSSTARQQICRGALPVTTVIRTCGIAPERDYPAHEKPHDSRNSRPRNSSFRPKIVSRVMQDSCIIGVKVTLRHRDSLVSSSSLAGSIRVVLWMPRRSAARRL
jgi:hypothetical protein